MASLFIKPIISVSRHHELMLPRKFVKKHGQVLRDFTKVFLKLQNGSEWEVNLQRRNHNNNGDDEIWFSKGWKEFAEFHSLFDGRLLVFQLDQSSSSSSSSSSLYFHIIIMDLTTSMEIQYPFFSATQCDDIAETEKGISDYSALERANAFNFKSQSPSFVFVAKPSYLHSSANLALPSNFAKRFLDLKKNGEDVSLVMLDGRVWNAKLIMRKMDSKTKYELSNGVFRAFGKDNDLKVGDVCVFELISEDKIITFRVRIFRDTDPSDKLLNEGQNRVCSQKQRKKRVASDMSKATCSGNKLTKGTSSSRGAISAHIFNSENPFFKLTIGSSHNPSLARSFVNKYLEDGEQGVELMVGERKWIVKVICAGEPLYGFFSSGWKKFARENDLQVGDDCFFELLNNYDNNKSLIIRVSIFKHSHIKCTK